MKKVTTLALCILSFVLFSVLTQSFALAGTLLFAEDINNDGIKETAYKANISTGSGGSFYDLIVKKGNTEVFRYPLNTVGSGYIVKDVATVYPGKEILVWTDQKFKDKYATSGQFVFYWYGWSKQAKRYSLYGWQITKKAYPIGSGKAAFQGLSDQSGTKNNFYKAIQLSDKLFRAVNKNDWKTVRQLISLPPGDINPLELATVKKYKSRFSLPLVVPSFNLIDEMSDEDEDMEICFYKAVGTKYHIGEQGQEAILLYPNVKIGKINGAIY